MLNSSIIVASAERIISLNLTDNSTVLWFDSFTGGCGEKGLSLVQFEHSLDMMYFKCG
jgi:hypothetical protein